MQCAVIRFAESKNNGLCLIDMPTGTGKTYLTGKLIEDYIKGNILSDIDTIIYLTPLKKNVDDIYEDVRKAFSDDAELFDNNALRLFPNYECVIENITEEVILSKIPQSLKKKESFKNLHGKILQYKNEVANTDYPKELLAQSLKDIRVVYEPKFRRDLVLEINKLARTKKERRNLINHKFSWVKVLYPACLTDERKVLFMTMNKFLSINDPIIDKPHSFISRLKSKSSLVFIDEFDATKDVILNQEIEKIVDAKINLVKLFSSITSALKGIEVPTQLFADNIKSKEAFEKMKTVMLEIENRFNLNYIFKLYSEDTNDRYFLFDDYQIHTISSDDKGNFVNVKNCKDRNQNVITFKNKNDEGLFYSTIYAIKNGINRFIYSSAILARNYMHKKNEDAKKNNGDRMEIEQAVSTVIDYYNLDRDLENIVKDLIINDITLPVTTRRRDIMDTDFYMNGYRYYDFADDISHDASTALMMCYLYNMPEKFMLSLAEVARIVGLSATASIKTVTGNYNLDYLKMKLSDNYYELPDDDILRLEKDVNDSLNGRYLINVKSLEIKSDNAETLAKQLFNNDGNIELYTGEFNKYQNNDNTPFYNVTRMVKAMLAVRNFLENKKTRVMLVLTNKNVKYSDDFDPYSQPLIEKVVESISKEIDAEAELPKLYYLFGNDFEKEKQKYYEEVSLGKKIILFSSYPAVGTGQNLQYEENVGDEELKEKRDIDSIYIELPTNIIVHNKTIVEEGNLNKYIYQMETLRANGEIDPFSAQSNIKLAFKQFMNPNASFFMNQVPYKTVSNNNHIVKILVQAVGRICRTRNKDDRHEVNIYVDNEIMKKVDFTFMKNRLMNPEFKKIVKLSNIKPEFNIATVIALNKASEFNLRVEARLNQILSDNRTFWSEGDMHQWKLIRDTVLKHPTISRKKLNEFVKEPGLESLKDFYIFEIVGNKINNYSYAKDATEKSFLFGKNHNGEYINIDVDGSRLRTLLSIHSVKKYFENKGYAQYFNANDGMILPVIYQNIYKGALGEEAGKAILESWGIQLAEIEDPTKFEKFDFCLKNNEDIYIDFKNWSDRERVDAAETKEKIIEKLNKVGGKKAFIINMIADECIIRDDGKVVEISSLCQHKNGKLSREHIEKIIRKLREAENERD